MGLYDTLKSAGQIAIKEIAARVGDGGPKVFLMLTVHPLFRGSETVVSLQLSTTIDRVEADDDPAAQSWEEPYSEFGAGAPIDAYGNEGLPELRVPDQLVASLRYRLALKRAPAGKPLWLNLARPYGVLGVAPWERDLAGALERPVLRLPDYPQRPVERSDILDSAIIVDADAKTDAADLERRVREIVDATLAKSSRTVTRVHVFAASPWYPKLKNLEKPRRVFVYNPEEAKTAAEAMKSGWDLRSAAWSNWVTESLKGGNLDVVHMVTRAIWANGGGCLLVSPSPCAMGINRAMTMVDLDEFSLLLNRVGAWAATFTPPSRDCAPAVAFAADALANMRPGAVLYNPGEDAGDAAALAASGELLFSARPSPAPLLTKGWLYCHPALVKGETPQADGLLAAALAGSADQLAQRAPLGQRVAATLSNYVPGLPDVKVDAPPAWVAAVQRYIETSQFDEARRISSDIFRSGVGPGTTKAIETLDSASEKAISGLTALRAALQAYKTSGNKD